MDLVIYVARQFGIKTRSLRDFGNLREYRMGDYTRWLRGLLGHFDRQKDALSFCVSGQRGTIAKSMYEEHLCVVAMTSIERGTQFFPLASYFLV